MKDKNIASEWQEVKESQEPEKFEVSKEEFDKLKEIERNKTIALQQEREKQKTIAEKLAEYEKQEQERLEQEKKKKGKYEELLQEKEERLKELEEKANAWEEYQTTRQEEVKNKINKYIEEIPKDTLEEYQDIIWDLNDEKKLKFLEKISWTVKKQTFDWEVKGEKTAPKESDIELEQAKKGWVDSFLNALVKTNI